jgi:glycosyltransferase involved in cell wall biosynthesis
LFARSHDVFDRLWIGSGIGPLDILKRIRVGLKEHFDIIHIFDHFPNVAIPFYVLKYFCKSAIVADWCDLYHLPGGLRETYGYRFDKIYNKLGILFKIMSQRIEISLRRKASAITVISSELKKIGILNGIPESKIFILEGGVNPEKIALMNKNYCRSKLGFSHDSTIIQFMGRCQNDIDIAMRSLSYIKDKLTNPILLLVGSPDPSNRLKAKKYNLENIYIEAGYVEDHELPIFLGCADIFVLPYKDNLANKTRWANKFGEYLAAGRPIVISNVGDQSKIVERNCLGLVSENSDSDFGAKIYELIQNPNLAREMGINARRFAENNISWKIISDKLSKIYENILGNKIL